MHADFRRLRMPVTAAVISGSSSPWGSPKILDVADSFDKWAKIRDESKQIRHDFITTEMELCRTFASLASTEYQIGEREAAEHRIGESEKAYGTVLRSLPDVTCVEERQGFEKQLRALREMLDRLLDRLPCTKRTNRSKM